VTELLPLKYPLVDFRPARHGDQPGNESQIGIQEVGEALTVHVGKDVRHHGADSLGIAPKGLLELQQRFLAHVSLE
jgi:hypothetical protein